MKSISARITTIITALLLCVCGLLSTLLYLTASQQIMAETEQNLSAKAADSAKIVARGLETRKIAVEDVAAREQIRSMNWQVQMPVLQEENKRLGYIMMGVAGLDGILRWSGGGSEDISGSDFFQQAVSGTTSISDPMVDKDERQLVIMIASPVKDMGGRISGVLVAKETYETLSQIVNDVKYAKTGYGFVINNEGTTVIHPKKELVVNRDNDFENVKKDPKLGSLVELERKMVAGESGYGQYEYDGVIKLMGYAPIKGTNWSLAVVAPKAEIVAGLIAMRSRAIMFTVVLVLIGIFIGVILGRRISRPITDVAKLASDVASGDLTIDIPEKYLAEKDEIGVLAKAMKQMAENLRGMIGNIEGGARVIRHSSVEINQANQNIAATMQQISASVQEIAAGLEEVSAAAEEVSSSAEEIETALGQLAREAESGSQRAVEINGQAEAMERHVKHSQTSAVDMYRSIQEKMKQAIERAHIVNDIANLATTIAGIADQTNLLALNAAIEAARAGEQGRGFAVVAEEVRKLAEESASTVHNIQGLTKEVEQAITHLVGNANEMLSFVNQTVVKDYEEMVEVGRRYREDAEMIMHLTDSVEKMTSQVLAAVSETSKAMESIAATMQQSASGAQEIAKGTENANQQLAEAAELSHMQKEAAEQFMNLIAQFKL